MYCMRKTWKRSQFITQRALPEEQTVVKANEKHFVEGETTILVQFIEEKAFNANVRQECRQWDTQNYISIMTMTNYL